MVWERRKCGRVDLGRKSISPGTKSKLVRQIDELRINGSITSIKEVRDETDRDGISIAIILEPDANVQAILNFLLQKTEMKIYYTYNMISIVDNAPKVLGLDKMISAYINHIKEVKYRASKFDLDKFNKRLEIVNGLIRVSQIPDEVIRVIRNAQGGKQGVINDLHTILNFSIIQATAIAELRLYRLNKTDVSIYYKEKEELEEKIKYLNLILNNQEEFDKYLIDIFKNIKKEYGVERRTKIENEELSISLNQEELIKSEPCWISLTKDGYLKRFSNRIFEANELSTFGIKENDQLIYIDKSITTNRMLIFTSSGNYLIIPIHKINESKWKDEGQHISDFVQLDKKYDIVSVIDVESFETKANVVLVTKQGIGKRTPISEFEVSRTSKPLTAISFKKKNDELIGVKVSNGQNDIIITTNTSHTVKFSENELPILGTKASGNTLVKVEHNWVSAFGVANNEDNIIFIVGNNQYKFAKLSTIAYTSRATKGLQIYKSLSVKNILRDILRENHFNLIGLKSDNTFSLINELKNDTNNNLLNDNFTKINKDIKYVINSTNYHLTQSNDEYNIKFDKETTENKITNAEEKINQAFKETSEKIKEIDEQKLDDILKKLKL